MLLGHHWSCRWCNKNPITDCHRKLSHLNNSDTIMERAKSHNNLRVRNWNIWNMRYLKDFKFHVTNLSVKWLSELWFSSCNVGWEILGDYVLQDLGTWEMFPSVEMSFTCHWIVFCITDPLWGEPLSMVDSPHKGPGIHTTDLFLAVCQNKMLNKQSSCQWFVMQKRSCKITEMRLDYYHFNGLMQYCSISSVLHWAIKFMLWYWKLLWLKWSLFKTTICAYQWKPK